MLVYGDPREFVSPAHQLECIAEQLGRAAALAPGLARHSASVSALIEAGRLLQGIADAEFASAGADRWSAATSELTDFLLRLGRAVVQSWDSAFNLDLELPALPALPGTPDQIELRAPEGYAFYALYPEAYVDAARRLALTAAPRVIALRSIGTSLGAVVAAALGAPAAVTLRPVGDPFARTVALAPELERELLAGAAHYVLVDEGPGQSGSSFGAVADWLQERGVPLDRIAFLPSHGGALGPQASEAHRRRWSAAQVVAGEWGEGLQSRLQRWMAPVIGTPDGPLIELSGGEWRRRLFAREQQWPASSGGWERRKFLVSVDDNQYFLKFAGLGQIGERKLSMGKALHAAGLSPEPVGLVHGFLVERWCGEGAPLAPDEQPVADVAHYLGTRARMFPAAAESGASLELLYEMTVRNVSLALGAKVGQAIERPPQAAAERVVRVCTDNKLDRCEWMRTASGRLLKTDSVDHHVAHDLIGCQDLAWDVAGAISEFGLNDGQAERLLALTEQAAGRTIDWELLRFCRLAYAAFRRGLLAMAGSSDVEESRRRAAAAARYEAELCHHLDLAAWRDSAGKLG
jgi:hypothetical protein